MPVNVNIRMYNQLNLGDCFLLSFKDENSDEIFMLIDFGSYHSNKDREQVIANNIKLTVQGKKLIIVLTHQHKDHMSGFKSSEAILQGLSSELWLSFLDDSLSEEGKIIRGATEKYWKNSTKVTEIIADKFGSPSNVQKMMEEKKSLDLFAEEQTGGKSLTSLLKLVGHNVKYLTPGQSFFLPGTSAGVRVYVLGPPHDKALLTKLNPGKEDEVKGLDTVLELTNIDISGTLMLNALEAYDNLDAVGRDKNFPFNSIYNDYITDVSNHSQIDIKNSMELTNQSIKDIYERDEWRKIDHDWLSEVGRLSLHMNNLTNNTSLVLAFELVQSKKVLLFVGDAQIGNWKSWIDVKFDNSTVNSDDLLSRTVFYKAGHHSSGNATLKQGLELMKEDELLIMIPVNEKVATKHGFDMLKPGMLSGYNRKSQGRVLRSDTIEQSEQEFILKYSFLKQADFGPNLTVQPDNEGSHLYLEVKIEE